MELKKNKTKKRLDLLDESDVGARMTMQKYVRFGSVIAQLICSCLNNSLKTHTFFYAKTSLVFETRALFFRCRSDNSFSFSFFMRDK